MVFAAQDLVGFDGTLGSIAHLFDYEIDPNTRASVKVVNGHNIPYRWVTKKSFSDLSFIHLGYMGRGKASSYVSPETPVEIVLDSP